MRKGEEPVFSSPEKGACADEKSPGWARYRIVNCVEITSASLVRRSLLPICVYTTGISFCFPWIASHLRFFSPRCQRGRIVSDRWKCNRVLEDFDNLIVLVSLVSICYIMHVYINHLRTVYVLINYITESSDTNYITEMRKLLLLLHVFFFLSRWI